MFFMIIQLDENTKIKDIEEEFSLFYPFLKVELHPLGGWKESHKSDTLEVYGDMSAVQLGKLLRDEFFLIANVFKKCKDQWTEITDEGNLSLKEQNEKGRSESGVNEETHYGDYLESEI